MINISYPLIIFILAFINNINALAQYAKGKVLGEKLEACVFAEVKNLSTGQITHTDTLGLFAIGATHGDTIEISYVPYSTEKREFKNEFLKVILIDRSVNDLGSPWTKRKYHKADKQLGKYYKKLYKKADKEELWNRFSKS